MEYKNSKTKIKYNGFLSSELEEESGVKQGNVKSKDHFKIYNKSLLDTVEASNLGVQIGKLNLGVSCCADDFLGMADHPQKLQCIIDIAQHYGEMFKISYGSDKTKILVCGSKIDQVYYNDIKPWKMNNEI